MTPYHAPSVYHNRVVINISALDFWIDRMLGRPMYPSRTRDVIVAVLSMGGPPDIAVPRSQLPDAVARAVSLILMSPDFYWR